MTSSPSSRVKNAGWILGIVLVIPLAVAFFMSAAARFNENDFMYAVAPAILGGARLYTDLPFLQAPLSIHLFNGVYQITGPEYFYVALRVVSMALIAASSVLVFLIARSLGGSRSALIAIVLFYCSFCIGFASMEIGNYSLSLFLLLLAFYIVLCLKLTPRHLAAAGILIGLAASARLNAALFSIPVLVFIVHRFGIRSRETAWFVLGGAAGSFLLLYYAVSDFRAFVFHNFDYHLLMNAYRKADLGADYRFAVPSVWFWLGMTVPQFLIAALSIWAVRTRRHSADVLMLVVLIATAFAVAASPGILRPQYLVVMAALLCVMTGVAVGGISRSGRLFQWVTYPVAVVVLGFAVIQHVQYNLVFGFANITGDRAAMVEVQRLAKRFGDLAGGLDESGACAANAISLSPLPVFGSRFAFSRYSATGPFLPTVAAQVKEQAPAFEKAVDLRSEVERRPPAAILTGYFPHVEAERMLVAYAIENDFLRIDLGRFDRADNMTLYLRRACFTDGRSARAPGPAPG